MSTADATITPEDLQYGLDDRPKPFVRALGLSAQHVLTMFGATIAVPLLLGPAMGFDTTQTAILISSAFIASGLATIAQLTIGSRLPIVQGVSFAFLGPFFAIIAANPGEQAMQYIAGGILAGAVVEIVIGYSGAMGAVRRFVTPITIGPVIALIGLSLFGAATGQVSAIRDAEGAVVATGNWWVALLTVGLVFVFTLVLAKGSRFFALFPILLAVVVAYLVAWGLSATGIISEGSRAFVSFDGVAESPWARAVTGERNLLLPWGAPIFDFGFFVAILAAYLASAIESFGDYHAIARVVGIGSPSRKQIDRGIGSEGVGCFMTGMVGGFASTSYTENIGLIGLTKVASRYVVLIGAVLLVALGFVTKIGAVIATIPAPIVGGVYLALFGLIAAIGLSYLFRADMGSQRNLLIVGFVLFMGLVVPDYYASLPQDWTLLGQGWLTNLARSIGGSGIAVAALLGLLLDNLLPGTDEERGSIIDETAPPENPHTSERAPTGRRSRRVRERE